MHNFKKLLKCFKKFSSWYGGDFWTLRKIAAGMVPLSASGKITANFRKFWCRIWKNFVEDFSCGFGKVQGGTLGVAEVIKMRMWSKVLFCTQKYISRRRIWCWIDLCMFQLQEKSPECLSGWVVVLEGYLNCVLWVFERVISLCGRRPATGCRKWSILRPFKRFQGQKINHTSYPLFVRGSMQYSTLDVHRLMYVPEHK